MKSLPSPGGLARKSVRAARYQALSQFRREVLRSDLVLYEAFAGTGLLCNPEAIFRELLAAPDLTGLRHVWVVDDSHDRRSAALAEFRHDARVTFVRRNSLAYLREVSTAKYLINNATFPSWFAKRDGQVYLNTWHGTPLKAMGYDMPGGAREAGNTLRNFAQADYLLSQNTFMTDQMYRTAYKLDGHFRGTVIEGDYPRVDRQELDVVGRGHVLDELSAVGLRVGRRHLVLYAPTWRGDTFADPSDDIDVLVGRVRDLQERLGDSFVVLLKTHQILERFVRTRPDLRSVLVPSRFPTNRVLGVVDTLVSDYSSIFFDFLATGRRIVFFTPDVVDYASNRGTYFRPDELPGPVCETVAELARLIEHTNDEAEAPAPGAAPASDPLRRGIRDEWQQRFTPRVGGSARRVVDLVFRRRSTDAVLVHLRPTTRTSVVVHVGNLTSNGITSAAINLVSALPADRFDVSVAYTRTASTQQADNAAALPPTVRQFARDGGMNGSKWQHLRRRRFYRRAVTDAHRRDADQARLWDDEWQRVFGDSRFDHVVDFSGYSPLWATLLLHSPDSRRSIWLHNDMAAEVDRVVGGSRPLARSLPSIFGLYPEYDSTVAVSAALACVNEEKLPFSALRGRSIDSAVNLIDDVRVRALASLPPLEGEPEPAGGLRPEWADALQAADDCIWFVTVGRYTREKNQGRLLGAFARIRQEEPRARLLLVGHGPLRSELEARIDSAGLVGSAFVTGALRNPFSVMKAADCFVLSSDYEGQPMVLLEAAVLGLPLVSTRFASIGDVLPGGIIHDVPASEDGLADGMRRFLAGDIAPAVFDADHYNREALEQFLGAIGASSGSERVVLGE